MVQIGKKISWTGVTQRQISELHAGSGAQVNITWLRNDEANVFGDSVEFQKFVDYSASRGVIITVMGDIPIPPPVPQPIPPTQEEIDNQDFAEQSFDEEAQQMIDDFWARVQTRYVAKGGTGQVQKIRDVRLIR